MFEHLIDTLQLWGEIVAEEYKKKLQNEGINATGKLSDSVKVPDVTVVGEKFTVYLQLEEYWGAIENGRQPTKNGGTGELRQNLLTWLKYKPNLPTPYSGDLPTEKALERAAYAISTKIHRFGYKGKRPLHRTLEELKDEIYRDIEEAIIKDIDADILNVLRTFEQ